MKKKFFKKVLTLYNVSIIINTTKGGVADMATKMTLLIILVSIVQMKYINKDFIKNGCIVEKIIQ